MPNDNSESEKRKLFSRSAKKYNRDYGFGWHFFTSVKLLFPLAYPGIIDYVVLFTAMTMAFNGLSEYLVNHIGQIPGKFYKELLTRNTTEFFDTFVTGTLLYVGNCLTLALINFSSYLLYLAMRKNLVNAIHKRYFRPHIYYRMNCVDNVGIDNPDQRITQDVERMCNLLAINVLPTLIAGPFVLAYYTWRTWIKADLAGVGLIYGYFIIGTIVNKFLIVPNSKWSARVEKAEGNFRYKHVNVREHAESSMLYGATDFEKREASRIFHSLLEKQFFQALWIFPSYFFMQFFDYYGSLVSYIVQYFSIIVFNIYQGKSQSDMAEIISNNAFVYIYLVNSFTRMTDLAINLGRAAGVLQRVADFVRLIDEIDDEFSGMDDFPENLGIDNLASTSSDSTTTLGIVVDSNSPLRFVAGSENFVVEFRNVSYSLPNDPSYLIMNGLTFTLKKGENLLITGPSGAGKSSFLRVLMRLWKIHSGSIIFGIPHKSIFHMPQSVYFPAGYLTLRQQLEFPKVGFMDEVDDYRILSILNNLDLNRLVDRCQGLDGEIDFEWEDVLTPGELQRLSFARILYHQPALAILDEATNSVTLDMEAVMYDLLRTNGIHYISVGHRPSLSKYHTTELQVDGKTGYRVARIDI